MAKRLLLFFLVISLGYLAIAQRTLPHHPKAAVVAESDGGYEGDDTDFC